MQTLQCLLQRLLMKELMLKVQTVRMGQTVRLKKRDGPEAGKAASLLCSLSALLPGGEPGPPSHLALLCVCHCCV